MKRLLLLLALAFAYLVLAPIAHAQLKCGPRDVVVKGLADRFSEVQAARGSIDEENIMELFISPTGSWTILATSADKNSCAVMGGTEGFEWVVPELPKPGRGT